MKCIWEIPVHFYFLILLALVGMSSPLPAADDKWNVSEQPELKSLHAKAPNLNVENLCQPVKTVMGSGHYLVPNPDGKTYDMLQIYFKRYGGPNTIAIMDFATGKVKTVNTGKLYANFHLAPQVLAPNGKLYLSMLDGNLQQQVSVYDPATNELKFNALAMPKGIRGETHPMVLGQDGMIYCSGTHPSGSVSALQINPATDKVTFYGPLGPSHAPSPCWAYSMATDKSNVYIASGKYPWYLVAYNRETKKSEVLLRHDQRGGYLGVSQEDGGGSCFVRTMKEKGGFIDKAYWLYQGKAIPMTGNKPWPEVPTPAPQPPIPEISFMSVNPDVSGEAVIWYRTPEAKAAATEDVSLPTNVEEGKVGQLPSDDVMHAAGWKDLRYQVEMYPIKIDRLIEIPDGRLLGTAGDYQGNFYFDPKTGKSDHPGICGVSHYSTTILDGKVYMSGYPSGVLFELDTARPWTANKRIGTSRVITQTDPQSNPRLLTYLKDSGVKKMMAAATAKGRAYFGGVWMREGNWGGLGWWDPATKMQHGMWKPFNNHQIRYMATADGGRVLVISTLPVDNVSTGVKKEDSATLFFFDTTTNKLLDQKLVPVHKVRCTGPLVSVGGSRVIGWTENPNDKNSSILYGVDAKNRKLCFTKKLTFPMPIDIGGYQKDPWDFRLGPDGMIWTFMGNKLARINPTDASVEFLGSTGMGGRMAFANGDLYLGGTEELRCIRKIAKSENRPLSH